MKHLLLSLTFFVLAGCASQNDLPKTNDASVWETYGKDQAAQGHIELTKEQLIEQKSDINNEAVQAYHQGYMVGQNQYCSQNPSALGRSGEYYRGICDDIDPYFRKRYLDSSSDHARGM
ncbi:DUF2799 domain-containing protein [Vibrio rumoiensis]|uniref:DUF2799 domain-containing protein n=1 Tax=Vibrio rumoiensis 1S-45 TaxID=1188252 RepID=A0A1E5DZ16_9VIBR|nr:DUF2799 domain-containing protein [Vibrio rumoiensis]OEF22995.1 hypothetical protein A1QC_13035 [Vibrio rumoiensis 1S-45]